MGLAVVLQTLKVKGRLASGKKKSLKNQVEGIAALFTPLPSKEQKGTVV